ncbi:MAG: 30S ribosomal protein S6 [Planctomycetia bacterium]|nr:30S ribosomal protein S6 [Planctomycetia bacterium]
MALNVYEGLFILDSSRFSRDPEGISNQISKFIQDAGGEILVSRFWEERRLAYPINGHRKGVYWLTFFRLDSQNLAELHRQFSLFDANIRNLFTKKDPRLVDMLVEHALAGPAVPQSEESPAVEIEEIEEYLEEAVLDEE